MFPDARPAMRRILGASIEAGANDACWGPVIMNLSGEGCPEHSNLISCGRESAVTPSDAAVKKGVRPGQRNKKVASPRGWVPRGGQRSLEPAPHGRGKS